MNTQQAINKMRKTREWTRLTPAAQTLYYELVWINYSAGWKKQFTCSSQYLCRVIGITQRTLQNIRRQLVEAGLITFRAAEKLKQPPVYSLVEGAPVAPQKRESEEKCEEKSEEKSDNNNIININSIKKKENKKKEKVCEGGEKNNTHTTAKSGPPPARHPQVRVARRSYQSPRSIGL